jgi:orotate phosphoribosyltransferase
VEDLRGKLGKFIEENCVARGRTVPPGTANSAKLNLDRWQALLDPESLPMIAKLMFEQILALSQRPGAIGGPIHDAGPILGAVIPLAAAHQFNLRGFLIREASDTARGREKIVNRPHTGDWVALVESAVVSGSSTIQAIDAVEEAGLKIVCVIPVMDLGEGGAAAIRKRLPNAAYAPLVRFGDMPSLTPTVIKKSGPGGT